MCGPARYPRVYLRVGQFGPTSLPHLRVATLDCWLLTFGFQFYRRTPARSTPFVTSSVGRHESIKPEAGSRTQAGTYLGRSGPGLVRVVEYSTRTSLSCTLPFFYSPFWFLLSALGLDVQLCVLHFTLLLYMSLIKM